MWYIFEIIQKKLTLVIPLVMLLGIVVGTLADVGFLAHLIVPMTLLMVYPMMVNLKFQELLNFKDKRLQFTALVINFVLIPMVAVGLNWLFLRDMPYAALGLLLASLVPTSGMTISWTGFAKGNLSAAVKMTVIGLILGSLLTPIYANILIGKAISIPMAKVFSSIVFVVFLPMLLGYITKKILLKKYGQSYYQQHIAQKFPPISTLGVLGIVFIAMGLNAKLILANPMLILQYFVPLAILYIANFALSTVIGKFWFSRGDAIALVYGTVMRNLSIALAIAMTAFGTEGSQIAIIIALGYIIQVQGAAWYVKFTNLLFGIVDNPNNTKLI